MLISETIKTDANVWERVREYFRALAHSFSPAITVRAKNENEFIARMVRMAAMAAGVAAISLLLPHLTYGFWIEGALLGAAMIVGAAGRIHPVALFFAACLGALFGLTMKVFMLLGLPYLGLAVLGMGAGLFMPGGKSRLNAVFSAMVGALLGAWAAGQLGPIINSTFPYEAAFALHWATLGLFIALGALPGHMVIIRDPVLVKVRRIRRKLKKKYRPYVDRALDKYFELGGLAREISDGKIESIITRREFLSDTLLEISDLTLALQEVDKLVGAMDDVSLDEREKSLRERRRSFRDADMKKEIDKVLIGIDQSRKSSRKLKSEAERLRLILVCIEMDMVSKLPGR